MEDCPLCANEVESLQYPRDPWVVEEIQSRFPDWTPEQGVCASCLGEAQNPFRP